MQYPRQSKIFKGLSLRLLILMEVLSLASCAHITIPESVSNSEWCHPFKNQQGQDIGASCDMFLTSNPNLLTADEWNQKIAQWLSDGGVLECTSSKTMIDAKVFIEDTCSQVTCDEQTKEALISRLEALAELGKK